MRYIKFLVITITMMAAISSCQKYREEVVTPQEPQETPILRAYAPGHGNASLDTKVSMEENAVGNIEVKWQLGDCITVYRASSEKRIGDYYVYDVDDKTGEASFAAVDDSSPDGKTPIINPESEYIAVYPCSHFEDLDERDAEEHSKFSWYYGEMLPCWEYENMVNFWFGDMSFLTGWEHAWPILFMKSARFSSRSEISFSYEVSMITLECTIPDFNKAGLQPTLCLRGVDDKYGYGDDIQLSYYLPEEVSGKEIRANILVMPTSASTEGERPVSLVYGDDGEITLLRKMTDVHFKAGKRYLFTQNCTLADIAAGDLPLRNPWTIVDFDETAATAAHFAGLREAINSRTSDEPVTLVFPNLTTLPEGALANVTGKFTLSAPQVTTLGGGVFSGSENITTINLPNVTTLGVNEFSKANSLSELTLALNGRVTSTDANCFGGLTTSAVDLTTHSTNHDGVHFLLANGSKWGPFKSINKVEEGDQYMENGVALGKVWKISDDRKSGIIYKTVKGIWEEYIDVEYADTKDKYSGLANMHTAITKDPALQYHHSFRSIHELNVELDADFSGESYVEEAKGVYYLPAIEELQEFLESAEGEKNYNWYACMMTSTGENVPYNESDPSYVESGNYYFSYVAYYTPFLCDNFDGLYGSNSFDHRDVVGFMMVDFE